MLARGLGRLALCGLVEHALDALGAVQSVQVEVLGFYTHDVKKRGRTPTAELAGLVASATTDAAPGRASRETQRTADVVIDPMIEEAARLLEEGAVEQPDVIDLAMVLGTGFPPFRGGPLRYADSVGRAKIADRIAARGSTPSKLLSTSGRFYS